MTSVHPLDRLRVGMRAVVRHRLDDGLSDALGEVVALDDRGRPSFQRLQNRMGLTKAREVRSAQETTPVRFLLFDVLEADGQRVEYRNGPEEWQRIVWTGKIPGASLRARFDDGREERIQRDGEWGLFRLLEAGRTVMVQPYVASVDAAGERALVFVDGAHSHTARKGPLLTPGGDVIRELIGAFPSLVLAEGDYVAIARHDGRTFQSEFKVQSARDSDVEVMAHSRRLRRRWLRRNRPSRPAAPPTGFRPCSASSSRSNAPSAAPMR